MLRTFSMHTCLPFLSLFLYLVSADSNLLARSPARGQAILTPALKASPQLQSGVLTPNNIFGRQTCDLGKYCSSMFLLPPWNSANHKGIGYGYCCSELSDCCSKSCTPYLGECCPSGYSCDSGEGCCGDGCMPILGTW